MRLDGHAAKTNAFCFVFREAYTRMHRLTNAGYRFGSYTRGDFKSDILYGVISFSGLEALMAPGFALVRDTWAEGHRASLPPEKTGAYQNRLTETVKAAAAPDGAYFEAVMGEALSLRRRVFGSLVDALFLSDARARFEPAEKTDIDQSRRLDEILAEGNGALFLLSDPRLFFLLRADLEKARRRGTRVFIAVSETDAGIFPREETLRKLLPDSDVECVRCEGPLDALDIGCAAILYYGERGLTECRNLSVPAFIRCVPESLIAKALSGQFLRSGRCDLFVPPGFDILPGVSLRKRTLSSFRQFAYLSDTYGGQCYALPFEELYRRYPEAFFSVYDETHTDFPPGVSWPETEPGGDWYADFCEKRDRALGAVLDGIEGVRRLGGWFTLDTDEEQPVPWTAQGEAKGILVHGALIEKSVEARVVISETDALSPRTLTERENAAGVGLILNYLFFLTPRLASLYNQLRAGRPKERTGLRGGHLDYLLCEKDGRRVETFPLYRKACVALMRDGSFRFFHFRLGGGACEINGQKISWRAGDVDAETPGDAAVFTPYLSCPDAGASKFTYTKPVGAGRVNLVLIQDQVVCARDGDVLLPCMGVALSLEREAGLRFLKDCGFRPDQDGYYSWEKAPALSVRLDPPAGFSPDDWARVQWAYGGGLTLIHGGESCFSDDGAAKAHLTREGWASPLSCQTQESDIGSMVRHPRTAIGLTKRGKLFALVFSGRSSVSAGADYREMCRLTQKLVPDAMELMNLDGGGSAVLGITLSGRFIEYSWPSTSPGTIAGMVRPIHSLFKIQL